MSNLVSNPELLLQPDMWITSTALSGQRIFVTLLSPLFVKLSSIWYIRPWASLMISMPPSEGSEKNANDKKLAINLLRVRRFIQ